MAEINKCPLSTDGVHHMGASTSCKCGYTLSISRFMFSVDIYDNDTKKTIVNDGFNCSHIETIKDKLLAIAAKIERCERPC